MTVTCQCSPYHVQLSGHDTIGTHDCDNEGHESATQEFVIGNNKLNKDQEELLLLDLREQL